MTADVHAAPLARPPTPAPTPAPAPAPTPTPAPTPAPAPPDPELNAVVQSVVNDLIHNAVFSASLQREKRKVQGLINSLVSRVRDASALDAASNGAPPPPAAPEAPLKKEAAPRPPQGVPLGDHRPRHVGRLPVTWAQTMDAVTVNVPVPPWVRKQHVAVRFLTGAVHVVVRGPGADQPVVNIQEPLVAPVETAACAWMLQDAKEGRQLTLELEKVREQWWARLFMSDDPALYTVVDATARTSTGGAAEVKADDADAAEEQADEEVDVTVAASAGLRGERAANGVKGSDKCVDTDSEETSEDETLEEAVAGVVSDVIDSVAGSDSEGEGSGSSTGPVAQPSDVGRQAPKRLLTEADIVKLVEQCQEQFEKGGPGSAEAAVQLGTFYNHGVGVAKNEAEAARLYKHGLQNGALDSSAAFQLGIIYTHGAAGIEADAAEAVHWWRLAATLGNSAAMFNLGVMAMNGTGCDMDPIAALRWWREATALNPSLKPPLLSKAQVEERVALAAKQKKERLKAAMSPEEKQRRREEALQKARTVVQTVTCLAAVVTSAVVIRYWWRNRL